MVGRHTWSKYEQFLPHGDLDAELSKSQSWALLTPIQKTTWLTRFEKVRSYPKLTWDYQMQFMTFKYDLTHHLPLFRICENTGFNDLRSTNTVNRKPKWMQENRIYDREFTQKELPDSILTLMNHIDSFTISGDSNLRKSLNRLKQRLS
jgi:hypothetical protein